LRKTNKIYKKELQTERYITKKALKINRLTRLLVLKTEVLKYFNDLKPA